MNITTKPGMAANLINYFNRLTGGNAKRSVWSGRMEDVILDDLSNYAVIRSCMREWCNKPENHDANLGEFIVWFKYDRLDEARQQDERHANTIEQSLDVIGDAVASLLANTKSAQIEAAVAEKLEHKVDDYIAATYGKIERTTKVTTEYGTKEIKGVTHEKFDTVLKFVANNEPVYLVGPAGSGKNVICKQVAEALGLEFYFTNAVTQEYKLTGFTDANGHFRESQFYKAFCNGGLFMLDEMDASIPEVLIILNAAIANRYFDFPAPIGKIEAHKDFRVIAAGNTFGYGADSSYVGRNTLDAASLDRFAMIEVEYDDRIAMNVTDNNENLVRFCNDFRKSAKKAGLQITVSYRAMSRMAKMDKLLEKKEILKTCLVKGLEKDDVHIILKGMDGIGGSEYMNALRAVEKELASA